MVSIRRKLSCCARAFYAGLVLRLFRCDLRILTSFCTWSVLLIRRKASLSPMSSVVRFRSPRFTLSPNKQWADTPQLTQFLG